MAAAVCGFRAQAWGRHDPAADLVDGLAADLVDGLLVREADPVVDQVGDPVDLVDGLGDGREGDPVAREGGQAAATTGVGRPPPVRMGRRAPR